MSNESLHTDFYLVDSSLASALEESRMSYRILHEAGDHPDIDYAGFCSHLALARFKKLLNDPTLTAERLAGMMRMAAHRHQTRDPHISWSLFMADYITRATNANMH